MLELFKLEEGKFIKFLMNADSEISKIGLSGSKEALMGKVKEYMQKAEAGYDKMTGILSNLSEQERTSYNNRLRSYKEQVAIIRNKIRREEAENKKILPKNGFVDKNLENTLATGIRTYDIGTNSLLTLKNQRDTIDGYDQQDNIKQNVNEADDSVSMLIIKKIKLKSSMVTIIFLEFLILVLIVYIKVS